MSTLCLLQDSSHDHKCLAYCIHLYQSIIYNTENYKYHSNLFVVAWRLLFLFYIKLITFSLLSEKYFYKRRHMANESDLSSLNL